MCGSIDRLASSVGRPRLCASSPTSSSMHPISIPETQTVALVRQLGGRVEFVDEYPVKFPGQDEVLAKVLYTGVCQSGTIHSAKLLPAMAWLTDYSQTSTLAQAPQQVPMASLSPILSSLTSEATKASAALSPLDLVSPSVIPPFTLATWLAYASARASAGAATTAWRARSSTVEAWATSHRPTTCTMRTALFRSMSASMLGT